MKDLMGMMKQVKDMKVRMQKAQDELKNVEITGQSGGGLVSVTLNGRSEMRKVTIDPSLMKPDEVEILEDLIVAATGNAKRKVESAVEEKMANLTEGLPIPPGLKLF